MIPIYVNIFLENYKSNAMIRNSTHGPEHRELLAAEKQWKEIVELAFEQLSEILMRVGADGVHRYMERI